MPDLNRPLAGLRLLLHFAFLSVIAAILCLAILSDIQGFSQARNAASRELQHRLTLFAGALNAAENEPIAAGLANRVSEDVLNAIPVRDRASDVDQFDERESCYRRVQNAAAPEQLSVCFLALRGSTVGQPTARSFRVLLKLIGGKDISYQSSGLKGCDVECFRIELQHANTHTRARWVLMPQIENSRGKLIAAFQCFKADEHWKPSSPDHNCGEISDTGQTDPSGVHHRTLQFNPVQTLDDPNDATPWRIRIAHLVQDGVLAASFTETPTRILDLPVVPEKPLQSLYPWWDQNEVVSLWGPPAAEQEPKSQLYWTSREARPGHPDLPASSRAMRFRPWLTARDNTESALIPVAGTGSHVLRATVIRSRDAILDSWDRVARQLFLDYAIVLALVISLYLFVMHSFTRGIVVTARVKASQQAQDAARKEQETARKEQEAAKQAQEALQRHAQELELVSRDRETLRLIVHRIQSPLQALLALHSPGSPSGKYLERINNTVQAILENRKLEDTVERPAVQLATVDLCALLAQIAQHASLIGIADVQLHAETRSAEVLVDDGAFGDAIVQILNHANRHREPGSLILIKLVAADGHAIVSICTRVARSSEGEATQTMESRTGEHLFAVEEVFARMGATLNARDLEDEVAFEVSIPLAG